MSVPIKINVGVVGEEPIKIGLKSPANTQPINVSAPIVIGHDVPEYDGPYTVTPSESVQTLETTDKKMTQDVTVDAIPSDYVGSAVAQKSSSDLTSSGATVTAPAGYYASDASKSAPDASWLAGKTIETDPSISVDENGLITSSYLYSTTMKPVSASGWADKNHTVSITVRGTGMQQLATKSSSDLTASGKTVTAPAGFYPSAATKDIADATWKSASTIGVIPDISVDSSGLITANCAGWTSIHPLTSSGYADADTAANIQETGVKTYQLDTLGATTYTPAKGSPIIITHGKYLTGDQTINAIPDSWYDMSGSMSWLGADATLVHEITPITVALKDTDFNTWTPSTTAATVVASQTLSTASQKYVATDLLEDGGYNYINVWNMKMPIVYTGTPTQKALPLFSCGLLITALFRRYSSYANLLIGNLNNNVAAQVTLSSFLKYYGKTEGTVTYSNSASYGFYYANVAPTISSVSAQSPTITLKTPSMSARCSDTYMSTTNAGLIDKTNTKLTITCKVYRVKQDSYIQGFYRYLAARVAEMDT